MNHSKYISSLIAVALVIEWGFPHVTLAAEFIESASAATLANIATESVSKTSSTLAHFPIPFMEKPGVGYGVSMNKISPSVLARKEQPRRPGYVTATAYSSTPDQTDSDPCTTANGYNVCKKNQENVIAANFLPFGTRVTFPEKYGERVFVVQDRMHPRFSNRVDIWMKTRDAAKQFGVRRLKMEILPERLASVGIQ